MFSNVFERFLLACFAQTLQINLPNPIFTPKTNIPLKNNLKKSHFYEFLPVLTIRAFDALADMSNLQGREFYYRPGPIF
jgi:hypothetical protein